MSTPLITKVKEAFRAYIASKTPISGGNYYRGVRAGLAQLPAVFVHCLALDPSFEDDNSPSWNATVTICIETEAVPSSGHLQTSNDLHDAQVAAVLATLNPSNQTDGIRVFCNSDNTTNRPTVLQEGFHIADFPTPLIVAHYDDKTRTFVTLCTFQRVQVLNTNGDS